MPPTSLRLFLLPPEPALHHRGSRLISSPASHVVGFPELRRGRAESDLIRQCGIRPGFLRESLIAHDFRGFPDRRSGRSSSCVHPCQSGHVTDAIAPTQSRKRGRVIILDFPVTMLEKSKQQKGVAPPPPKKNIGFRKQSNIRVKKAIS